MHRAGTQRLRLGPHRQTVLRSGENGAGRPGATEAPNPKETGTALPEETEAPPQRVYTGPWGEKFADQLTEGEVIQTENSYRSANISVTLTHVEEQELVYSIAEVYVSDIRFLRTASGPGVGTTAFVAACLSFGGFSI